MTHSVSRFARLLPILLLCVFVCVVTVVTGACSTPEDPARVAIRARLMQDGPMSHDEIARLLDEVAKAIDGRKVQAVQNGVTQDMSDSGHEVVLGMLTNRAGVFDEGLKTIGSAKLRVMNAPGRPSNAELDAARHLMINVETFLPQHFEFTSGVASDEFTLDLVVGPK